MPALGTVTKDARAFRKTFRETDSIRASMNAAGYSKSLCNQGMHGLPKKLRDYVNRRRSKLEKHALLGRAINAQQQEDITRGALLANVVDGKDRAVNSLKLLGQDKRVGMWGGDNNQAVIIMQPPTGFMELMAKHLQISSQSAPDLPVISGTVEESKT